MADKDKEKKQVKRFMKMPAMQRVLIAVAPAALGGIYLFGWRVAVLLLITCTVAFFIEALFVWRNKKPVTQAAFVTAVLLTLSLPPSIPFWMAAVGTAFAMVFGKMAFGGMGANIFNPALVGRCFLYISFPLVMTAGWNQPATDSTPIGGFTAWQTDAVSTATPLDTYKKQGAEAVDLREQYIGRTAGSSGETSVILILLGAVFLIWKKAASWQIMLSSILGLSGMSAILHTVTPAAVGDPLFQFSAGGFLFGAVFMATDPVSAARTKGGKWVYGAGFGIMTVILRGYSNFSCGVMYSILMMNMLAPLIDRGFNNLKARKKAKAEAAEEAA